MGYIYKVTNNVNGKIYIGQTSQTIKKRWWMHVYQSFLPEEPYLSLLHRAIKKYGEDSFTVEMVEECDDCDLNEREIYWIDYYDSHNNGYNLSLGGGGWRKCDDKKLKELWDAGYTAGEIADKMNLNQSTLSSHLRSIGVTKEQAFQRGAQSANKTRAKPIHQYDADGNYIREFATTKEAQESIGGKKINAVQPNTLYGGYQWRRFKADKIDSVRDYYPKNEIKQTKQKKSKSKEVHQYSISGEYIQSFKDSGEAARYLNKNDSSKIREACRGEINQIYGYQWKFEKFDKIDPIGDSKTVLIKPRSVHQYSLDGEYIQSFKSPKDAAAFFDKTSPLFIRKVCREEAPQAYGFIWRYYKVDNLFSN